MRRRLAIAFALVASLLVATAPVAASHSLAVASHHDTAAEFNNGTLTNVSVSGSGSDATVVLDDRTIDGFEDGGISEYGGNTSEYSVQTSTVFEGADALQGDVNDNNAQVISSTSGLAHYPAPSDDFSVRMRIEEDQTSQFSSVFFGTQGEDGEGIISGYAVQFEWTGDDVKINRFDSGSPTTLVENDSPTDTLDADEWYNVTVEWHTNGDINVTVADSSGTVIARTDANDNTYTSEGVGFRYHDADGSADNTYYFDAYAETSDADSPGTYISANHTVEDSEQGFVNITTISNATATITWETNDGTGWSQLNQTTGITTAANHTFTWSVESNDTVRVNVTVFNQSGNGVPTFTMADEGVQFTANTTSVNNSSATPTGDLSSSTPTLEIGINDSDFALSQGDSVAVEFFVDGSSIGTDTLTTNGTASQSISNELTGGDHTWHVVANDSYGHSVTSQTFDISTPGNLSIRSEELPYPLITDCAANVTFYEDTTDNPTIVTRSDDDGDGNISFSGLPTGTEFVADIKCDGWNARTIIINSLVEQQSAFLINNSTTTVENRFTVEDRSGDFPPEDTEIIIQKAINRSEYDSSADGYSWINVAGDDLGADEAYTTDLIDEDRYRILVQNEDGDQRILGAYTADTTGTINLVVGRVILDPEGTDQPAYSAERTNNTGEPVRVTFEYNDSVENTTKIWLHIYEYNNASNELLANTSFTPSSGNYGVFSNTVDVPSSENDTTWVVDFHAVRDGEDDITAQIIVGGESDVLPDIPEWLLSIIYVGTLLIVAGLFSQLNADVGALVVAGLGGLFLISGFMPGPIGSGVVLLSMMVAGVLFVQGRRGGGF